MYNIMVVDDEAIIRRGLRTIIHRKSSDFIVVCEAYNGVEALKLINQYNIHVVISDVKMPKMDGIELVKQISLRYPRIVTVILSGYNEFSFAQQAIKYKVYDYILKPLDSDEMESFLYKLRIELKSRISDIKNREYLDMHLSGKISLLYTLVKQKDLILNIKLMKKQVVNKIIDDIFIYMKDSKMDLNHIKQFTLELLNVILNEFPVVNLKTKTALNLDNTSIKNCIEHLSSIGTLKVWLRNNIAILMDYLTENDKSSEIKVIQKIKKYIKDNYEKDITLNTLAKKFYLNPCYLSDLFKNKTGQNFLDYLTEVRIGKSIELLKDDRLKIHQISHMVGYASSNHYNRIFKKITGITPGEYRKKY